MNLMTLRRHVERLDRAARSPGASIDAYDRAAFAYALTLVRAELDRLEAQERARRSEDDTARFGK